MGDRDGVDAPAPSIDATTPRPSYVPQRLTPKGEWGRCLHIADPCTTLSEPEVSGSDKKSDAPRKLHSK
jgi:hypothetical protein